MREVIIACDFANAEKLWSFLQDLAVKEAYLKIGMELFYAGGLHLLTRLKKEGYRIFLDLKLHDIPNTVYQTMKVLADYKVDMVDVHAAGGQEMMKAAKRALHEKGSQALLLAVTQLTSTDQTMLEKELWIPHAMDETVLHYALNAQKAGCDGVICSPLEARKISEYCGKDFISVTPGIRFQSDQKADQKRVTTPAEAAKLGSHYIVIGRSITQAENPRAAYDRARKMFQGEQA